MQVPGCQCNAKRYGTCSRALRPNRIAAGHTPKRSGRFWGKGNGRDPRTERPTTARCGAFKTPRKRGTRKTVAMTVRQKGIKSERLFMPIQKPLAVLNSRSRRTAVVVFRGALTTCLILQTDPFRGKRSWLMKTWDFKKIHPPCPPCQFVAGGETERTGKKKIEPPRRRGRNGRKDVLLMPAQPIFTLYRRYGLLERSFRRFFTVFSASRRFPFFLLPPPFTD